MRSNLPITQVERHLDAKQPIVTKTDLNGRIIYANPAFIELSGFSESELLGQPHNIVRHPDMPPAAFADMWQTLKADLPWRGLVKNRSKDGSFYWVDAYATPLIQNGQKMGYMSVRSKPSASDVAAAERLYRNVNAGLATMPSINYPAKMSIKLRLALMCILPMLFIIIATMLDWAYAGIAVATVSSGLCALWIWNAMQQALQQMKMALQKLGEGDFKFEVHSHEAREFRDVLIGLQSTKVNLRAIVADVVSSAQLLDNETSELNGQIEQVRQRSQANSDGIASVAAALEELSVSVGEISEATERSAQLANQTMSMTNDGVLRMSQTREISQKVEQNVRGAQQEISELARELASINRVSQTIRDIADQTNLLALNAAIEAARAGEQGRGFAVVADEVRTLAERTKVSTEDIESLTRRVLQQSDSAFETMNLVVKQVAENSTLTTQNHDDLLAIKASTQGVSASAQDIAGMLNQQQEAATAVAASMERMSALSEQNSASMDVVNHSCAQMDGTAKALNRLVKHFEHSL